jgi:hypothetical protein
MPQKLWFLRGPKMQSTKKLYYQSQRNPPTIYTQPNNLTFHNLCKYNNLPAGTRQLLGLNLKFSWQQAKLKTTSLKPQWHPPPAPLEIEEKLTDFQKLLKKKQQELVSKTKRLNLSNLTSYQKTILNQLKNNRNIIIKPADKNLGQTPTGN